MIITISAINVNQSGTATHLLDDVVVARKLTREIKKK